jgi:hypothetical protein
MLIYGPKCKWTYGENRNSVKSEKAVSFRNKRKKEQPVCSISGMFV